MTHPFYCTWFVKNSYFLILGIFFVFSPVPLLAQWEWSNPKPQGNRLEAITQIDGTNKLVAVGYFGTILNSVDYGVTWNNVNAGVANNLLDIQFINDSVGYIAGDGIVLKTLNGGSSWIRLLGEGKGSGTERLNGISFLNKDTGYVVGIYETILKTKDGGLSWDTLSYDPDFLSGNYLDVYFTNKDTGYIAVHDFSKDTALILRTLNGGKTWDTTYIYTEGSVSSFAIHFPTPTTGYIAGGGTYSDIVVKTTDAGETWDTLSSPTLNHSRDVYFINADTGYITSDWSIYKTADGGNTWSNASVSNFKEVQNMGIIFLNADTGYVVGEGGLISMTSDKGVSWNVQTPQVSSYMTDIHFPSENVGYAAGRPSTFLKTIDKGINWVHVASPGLIPAAIHFVNNDTGYVVSSSGSIKTTVNGGSSWTSQTTNTSNQLNDIFFLNDSTGYAVGWGGSVLKTNNRGINWNLHVINGNPVIFSVHFPSDSVGYIAGYYGNVYKTNDAGNSWDSLNVDSTAYFIKTCFINDTIGFVVSSGSLYKTIDGGTNWTKKTFGTSLSDIYFVNDTTGYILARLLGGENFIYKTLDAGGTWYSQPLPTNTYLRAFSFNGESGFAAGDGGAIIKTINGGVTCPNAALKIEGDSSVCQGTTVDFLNLTSHTNLYTWKVNGEVFSNAVDTSYQFKSPGEFTIMLSADNSGCVDSASKVIIVTPELHAGFTPADTTVDIYYSSTVNFMDTTSGVISRHWNFGDGTTDTTVSPSHSYSFTGTFIVTLVVNDATCTDSAYKTITVINSTGIDEQLLSSVFLYPNPNNGYFRIELSETLKPVMLTITNVLGKEIYYETLSGKSQKDLDFSKYEKGIYFLRLNIGQKISYKKIIIQ